MSDALPRKLGLLHAVALVSGTLIGSGIFLVPNLVSRDLGSPPVIFAVWILAGLLSLAGGLAFAELGAMFPASGGLYVYLRESYGLLWAFLCGWTFFFAVLSGAIAWLAVSFSGYLSYFVTLKTGPSRAVALLLIALLTFVNHRGVTAGARVQVIFTALRLAGIAVLAVAALLAPPGAAMPAAAPANPVHVGAALFACLLACDGWVSISLVAGEVRNPRRNVPLALALGLGISILVYLLVNLAYLRVLPAYWLSPAVSGTDHTGALLAERIMGPRGAAFSSLLILISIVGSLNGWIMTAPRLYFAQASDGLFFRRFAEIHPRFATPSVAIVMQGVWAATLAITGAYEGVLSYSTFAAWSFYLLAALGVMICRRRDRFRERPYRMFGYPLTLLLFLLAAFGVVFQTLVTAPGASFTGIFLIATGVPAYFLWRKRIVH